jgi:uncharacterized protein (TIGR02466 family)
MENTDEDEEVTLDEALDLALQCHQKDDFEQAADIYQQVLAVDPDNAVGNHLFGVLAFQTENLDLALELIDKALATTPDFAEAHNNRGLVLQQLKRPDEAADSFRMAISQAPDFAEAHVNLGSALDDLELYEDAAAQFQKALALSPDHIDAHNDLGLVLHKLVRFEEAVSCFRNALNLAPDFAEAQSNMGSSLMILGRHQEALENFEAALASIPDSGSARFNQGNALQKLGRLEDAADAFDKANQRKSDYRVLHCLYGLGHQDAFEKKLETAIQKDDTDRAVASVSAFAAHQWGKDDPYPFCKNPLDFVRVKNILTEDGGPELIEHLKKFVADGTHQELPDQGHITAGFTSLGNLFNKPHPALDAFKAHLAQHVDAFRKENLAADCTLISAWPESWRLEAWYLRLLKGGQVNPHIHDPGWLSGTLYLNVPDTVKGNEGAIAFGLQGDDMPVLNADYPQKVCRVRTGDLVLFPASLFHRVVPFQSEEERLCIAYDVVPLSG